MVDTVDVVEKAAEVVRHVVKTCLNHKAIDNLSCLTVNLEAISAFTW